MTLRGRQPNSRRCGKMTEVQSKILQFLENYIDPSSGECTPSQKQIAKRLQISRGYVGQALRQLAKDGHIEIEERWMHQPWDGGPPFMATPASRIHHSLGDGKPYRVENRYTVRKSRSGIMSTSAEEQLPLPFPPFEKTFVVRQSTSRSLVCS